MDNQGIERGWVGGQLPPLSEFFSGNNENNLRISRVRDNEARTCDSDGGDPVSVVVHTEYPQKTSEESPTEGHDRCMRRVKLPLLGRVFVGLECPSELGLGGAITRVLVIVSDGNLADLLGYRVLGRISVRTEGSQDVRGAGGSAEVAV
jgi:hypothetical protein